MTPHMKGNGVQPLAPRSPFYHGPFGRMFPCLPRWEPLVNGHAASETEAKELFRHIAVNEMIESADPGPETGMAEGSTTFVPEGATPEEIAEDDPAVLALEAEFSSDIPAAYTYFGQFIDHDVTFDPTSSLMRENDPNGLRNFRTPRLDLDNLYAGGPGTHPFLYEHDGGFTGRLIVDEIEGTETPGNNGKPLVDLQRNKEGRALIGDPRNDENSIVAGLQIAFIQAHNRFVEHAKTEMGLDADEAFKQARRALRWLYQYVVWNDFVRGQIANDAIADQALHLDDMVTAGSNTQKTWKLGFKHLYNWKSTPFMPVEFSVAAYRFGHSMVRNGYRTNFANNQLNFTPIFSENRENDLRGFRFLAKDADGNTTLQRYLQWDWFLEMGNGAPFFPQHARKIDEKLARSLASLPEVAATGDPLNVLAWRNLMRGWAMELPSGTDVANFLNITPIPVDQDHDSLWFYILKEAGRGANPGGKMLGQVGSTIVCSVFAGLLAGDPNSFYTQNPTWTPDTDPLISSLRDKMVQDGTNTGDAEGGDPKRDADDWTLASIIRFSGQPVGRAKIPSLSATS